MNDAYQQPLQPLEGVSPDDLRILLEKTVEVHPELAEEVNARLDRVRETTGERVNVASKVEEPAVKKELSPEEQKHLLKTLKFRFHDPEHRKLHERVKWTDVERALKASPEKLWSLQQLEATGGEPDVIAEKKGEFVFGDCSAESPSGRRNVVFDAEAQGYRKKHYPDEKCNGNAVDKAAVYGVDLMDEDQYRALQKKLKLDRNTWSWLKTPADIRKSGNAVIGFRYAYGVSVDPYNASIHDDSGAFRASLSVRKA